jgi:hypothetical protein
MTPKVSQPAGTDGVKVTGRCEGNPPAGSVVLIERSSDGSESWPQTDPEVVIDSTSGEWSGLVDFSGDDPGNYRIAVAYVGQSGRAVLDFYKQVVDNNSNADYWPWSDPLPDVIRIEAEVTVVYVR